MDGAVYGIGIESSCDETGVALIRATPKADAADCDTGSTPLSKWDIELLANPLYSQIEQHREFGGVIPENASRLHLEKFPFLLNEALEKSRIKPEGLSFIGVTTRPGLVGSLVVGYNVAQAISALYDLPVVPINHLEAHLLAVSLQGDPVSYPFVGLLVSGGNTSIYYVTGPGELSLLGDTLDDAAGEALDKAASLLSMGYPGGPLIERAAEKWNGSSDKKGQKNPLPKLLKESKADQLQFSFSGLKTALYYHLKQQEGPTPTNFLANSFQERVFELIERNLLKALELLKLNNLPFSSVIAAGGVMANKTLKKRLADTLAPTSIPLYIPRPEFCTDNAAMIAASALSYFTAGRKSEEVISSRSGYSSLQLKVPG